ncbi:MAG: S8 family serine peptidase, partial [Steroidobacteraceae bacterium]
MAQIALPRLPTVPLPLPVPPAAEIVRGVAATTEQIAKSSTRIRADALRKRYPGLVERDPRGAPMVRAVILALAPDPQALQRALASGYEIQSDVDLAPLGARAVTLVVPRNLSTNRALRDLRAADAVGSYDFDHLFTESADAVVLPAEGESRAAAVDSGTAGKTLHAPKIGLIDSGVDAAHPVFSQARPQLLGCGGRAFPSAHGTAVASLLVGSAQPVFHGAAPAAPLVAVDVYCGLDQPGGRTRDIIAALAQLAVARVAVINISMVGPHNVVLQAVVHRVQQQGILIVAAAGNDGPRAAPLYPAAYPDVIAVTAVDARDNVLLEACGGNHVLFAAPGADMMAAQPGNGYAVVRGTSYAAPLVTGLVQRLLSRDDAPGLQRVVQLLAEAAEDRGRKGRDARYGIGVVARDLRVAPQGMMGKAIAQ